MASAKEWAERLAEGRKRTKALQAAFRKAQDAGLTVAEGIEAGIIPPAGPRTTEFVKKYGRYGTGR